MRKGVNKKVGRMFPTTCGIDVLVLKYVNMNNILVEFQDDYKYRSVVSATNLNKGKVLNPYFKSVYGIGYLGEGEQVCQIRGVKTQSYKNWAGAMTRCYSEKTHNRSKSYIDCDVSEVWHCYQNFGDWYDKETNKEDDWQLDKDLLVKGNKVYSPETCCFLPREINAIITKKTISKKVLPVGVVGGRKAGGFTSSLVLKGKRKSLGVFETSEGAYFAYKLAKESYIKSLALKWKGKLSYKAFEALMNWTLD